MGPRRSSRPDRAVIAAALTALTALTAVAGAGCSATSEPVGNGACDGFCIKVVNQHCAETMEHDACIAACLNEQRICPESMSEVIRCSANEGAIACDPTTLGPAILACDAALEARARCLYAPDAGPPDGPLLPNGL